MNYLRVVVKVWKIISENYPLNIKKIKLNL